MGLAVGSILCAMDDAIDSLLQDYDHALSGSQSGTVDLSLQSYQSIGCLYPASRRLEIARKGQKTHEDCICTYL
jgi:hypothetical protein